MVAGSASTTVRPSGDGAVDYFTSRNLAILALVQIGTLVADVLGAGAVHKWYSELPTIIPVPLACRLLAEYGWLGLAAPLGWMCVAVAVLSRQGGSGRPAAFVAGAGVILLLLLLLVGWVGAVQPWFRLLNSYD